MPTTRLRDGVEALSKLADQTLRRTWMQVQDAQRAREALGDLLPVILATYAAASAALAAEWYDDERDLAGIVGRFQSVPAELGEQGAQALAGFAVEPLFSESPDWEAAVTRASGGVQLRIANASRDTVIGSTFLDPGADGWQRTGDGSCAFCRMLIGRGAVYKTQDSSSFGAHDHCNCSVVPAWGGQPIPVKPYKVSALRELGPDGKPIPISKAERARVNAWIAEHDI